LAHHQKKKNPLILCRPPQIGIYIGGGGAFPLARPSIGGKKVKGRWGGGVCKWLPWGRVMLPIAK